LVAGQGSPAELDKGMQQDHYLLGLLGLHPERGQFLTAEQERQRTASGLCARHPEPGCSTPSPVHTCAAPLLPLPCRCAS
jgi:hypothetical protein